MHNQAAVLDNDTRKLIWDFDIRTDHLIYARNPDLIEINKKKANSQYCGLCCTGLTTEYNWGKMKRRICTSILLGNRKNLSNIKVTIIPIVIGVFGTVTKGLLKRLEDLEIGGRLETIQTAALLRTARIPRRILDTWGDLLSRKL